MRHPDHHRRLCRCASQPRALALCWLKRSPPSAGAVPVFFNYVWNCKQETNVCIFLGIQDAASVLDDCTRDTVGPLITQAGDGLWGAFGSLCV